MNAALEYISKGWKPIPIPHKSKAPIVKGWSSLVVTETNVKEYFNGSPQNIGIRLGAPSGWLVDIDLDCKEAVELAPEILPQTLMFGRASRPNSHWLYYCPNLDGKGFRIPDEFGDDETICEIRSTRQQTVFPPSTHTSGEAIEFSGGERPINITSKRLTEAVGRLALAATVYRHTRDRSLALAASVDDMTCLENVPEAVVLAVRDWFATKKATSSNGPRNEDIDEAVRRYNDDHRREYPKNKGECPMCGHKGCFGTLPENDQRWACFSASHGEPGIKGKVCVTGDALDIDSYQANQSRISFLKQEGYLEDRQAPTFDDDVPHSAETDTRPIDCRPQIEYQKQNGYLAVAAALPILAECGKLYQRGGRLVQIANKSELADSAITRDDCAPIINDVSSAYLWEVLSEEIAWVKYDSRRKKGDKLGPSEPPANVVQAIHTRKLWPGMPNLKGVVTIPILRPDGTVHIKPGYDRESGLFYSPSCAVPELKQDPNQFDALSSTNTLLEAVQDFPFETEVCRSVWLSTVLACVGRSILHDGVPLTLLDANTPGSGKTLLADVSAIISTGMTAARSPYVKSDDELRKRITAHMMAGDQIALIDNIPAGTAVGWPSLDNALTANVWADRELGKSSIVRVPMTTVWMATGNNVGVAGDASRRTVRVRLVSEQERPEERTGFLHEPLVPWVRRNRTELLGAALTVLRAYLLAGQPKTGLTPIGSFDGWSRIVRNSIVWAGFADPAEAFTSREEGMDEAAEAHAQLMANWCLLDDLSGDGGLTCAQILGQCDRRAGDLEPLVSAIEILCPVKGGGLPTTHALGKLFRGLVDRPRQIDGEMMSIRRSRVKKNNTIRWLVNCAKRGG